MSAFNGTILVRIHASTHPVAIIVHARMVTTLTRMMSIHVYVCAQTYAELFSKLLITPFQALDYHPIRRLVYGTDNPMLCKMYEVWFVATMT